jgi:hypothetical protein
VNIVNGRVLHDGYCHLYGYRCIVKILLRGKIITKKGGKSLNFLDFLTLNHFKPVSIAEND